MGHTYQWFGFGFPSACKQCAGGFLELRAGLSISAELKEPQTPACLCFAVVRVSTQIDLFAPQPNSAPVLTTGGILIAISRGIPGPLSNIWFLLTGSVWFWIVK